MEISRLKLNNHELESTKRAWLRIFEAFVAVLIVFGVVLVLLARQRVVEVSVTQQTSDAMSKVLEYVSRDDRLRAEVLVGNLSGVDALMKNVAPGGMSYTLKNCTYNSICAYNEGMSGCLVRGEVYSQERLIVANLTYKPEEAVKLKIFMWKGGLPEGCDGLIYGLELWELRHLIARFASPFLLCHINFLNTQQT